ncbi:NACHT domain-containing protein [Maribacter sp. 2307UL18-2]
MPFLYKGADFEVLEDYVEVEIGSLNLSTLNLENSEIVKNINNQERLISNQKILFLGAAGFGKTTLQRYAILSILNEKTKSRFLNKSENVIPIFVQLKLLKNISPSPILEYTLNSISFIKSRKHFTNLLIDSKLMFFLDGYDEIYFGEGRNFIREELEAIMFPMEENWKKNINKEDIELYELFNQCRVWLSSRKDFFYHYPLLSLGSGEFLAPPANFRAVQLMGVGSNRNMLVSKIFKRYTSQKKFEGIKDKLNDEYFIESINQSNDQEFRDMSKNPLFLTVMCYLYIDKVKDSDKHNIDWIDNIENLISDCIELLLKDLDHIKAQNSNLSDAQIEAITKRRNDYYDEKVEFLKYFAAKTFELEPPVFNDQYLNREIVHFVNNYKDIDVELRKTIIRELKESKKDDPNFAMQLINCNVFTVIQKDRKGTLYDFPHRRFREVLAAKYYYNPEEYSNFLKELGNRGYLEFMNYFVTTSRFKDSSFQNEVLMHVLRKSKQSQNFKQSLTSSFYFTKYLPENYSYNKIVEEFIENQIERNTSSFKLSYYLLTKAHFSDSFVRYLKTSLEDKFHSREGGKFELICEVLFFVSKLDLQDFLIGNGTNYEPVTGLSLIKHLFLLSDFEESKACLNSLIKIREYRYDLWFSISNMEFDDSLVKLISNLDWRDQNFKVELLFFVKKYSPDKFSEFFNSTSLFSNKDVFTLLIKSKRDRERYLKSFEKTKKQFYFSQDSINDIWANLKSQILHFETISDYKALNEIDSKLLLRDIENWLNKFKRDTLIENIADIIREYVFISKKYVFEPDGDLTDYSSIEKQNKSKIKANLGTQAGNKNFMSYLISLIEQKNSIKRNLFFETNTIINDIKYRKPNYPEYFK